MSKTTGENSIKREIDLQSTHRCLNTFLILGGSLGIFPVQNAGQPTKAKLRFISVKFFYSLLVFSGSFLCATWSFITCLYHNIIMIRLVSVLFHCQIAAISFFNILVAKKWGKYISLIHNEELKILKKYKPDKYIKKKIDLVTFLSVLLAIGEHSLAVAFFSLSDDCLNEGRSFEHYIRKQYHFLFEFFNYNGFIASILLIFSWLTVFIWNFGDLTIIVFSIIYISRFNQITNKIKTYIKTNKTSLFSIYSPELQKLHDKFWNDVRQDYGKMQQLCAESSKLFGMLIISTYTFNMVFILIQMFISLRPRQRFIEVLYFVGSFSFVVARTVTSSIYGGWLYEAGRELLPVLNAVPNEYYSLEVATFIKQIDTTSPRLTGLNFFTITKGLVLSIAASIITYELALIQFNKKELDQYLAAVNFTTCY